jgi:hypothetical protein
MLQQYKTGDPWHARPIARAVFRWFWQNDEKQWVPYEPAMCVALEAAMLKREYVVSLPSIGPTAAAATQYEVNIVEMCQFRKNSKFHRRPVKRAGTPISPAFANSVKINAAVHSFNQALPDHWSPMQPGQQHVVVPLDLASPEAIKISRLLNATIGEKGRE